MKCEIRIKVQSDFGKISIATLRKGKNVLQIVKEELKLPLFTDNVIVYVKHLMEFTDNLVKLKK